MPEFSIGAELFIGFIIVQRLAELVLAASNTRRLLQNGAREYGAGHYPFMVAIHVAWIAALIAFGAGNAISMGWLIVFIILQFFRVWVLVSLGRRWTTRIIVTGEPLIKQGIYAYVRHPNYWVAFAEIVVAPLVLGLYWVAAVFAILKAVILYVRIKAEDEALSQGTPQ